MKNIMNIFVFILLTSCGFTDHRQQNSEVKYLTDEQSKALLDKGAQIAMQYMESRIDSQNRLHLDFGQLEPVKTKSIAPYKYYDVRQEWGTDNYLVTSYAYVNEGFIYCPVTSIFSAKLEFVKIKYSDCSQDRSGVSVGNR